MERLAIVWAISILIQWIQLECLAMSIEIAHTIARHSIWIPSVE